MRTRSYAGDLEVDQLVHLQGERTASHRRTHHAEPPRRRSAATDRANGSSRRARRRLRRRIRRTWAGRHPIAAGMLVAAAL